MTTTILTWAVGTPTAAETALILNKAEEMQLAGKTDNNPTRIITDTTIQVTRIWTTLADAEEWLAFVEQYSPVSATIES
jgi:hypothetical protein